MINLTTRCGTSDTVCCALAATLAVLFTSFLPAQDAPSQPNLGQDKRVSSFETSDDPAEKPQPIGIGEVRPVPATNGQPVSLEFAGPRNQDQTGNASNPQQDVEPEVLMRGPLHEAFADAYQADPKPNPIIDAKPPEPIDELPPEFRPEGENVQWIPGYWAWDEDQTDFIWISGVWRDVPPNQRWVPGYWEQAETGFRWVSGFWTTDVEEQLSYLPQPPVSLEQGPSISSPGDNYFYSPGNWEYQTDNFVWRTGCWQPRVADWVWIPARYVWTPRGCIYRRGYWDYEFDNRGTAFAPVRFRQPVYRSVNYQYRPAYCINTGADFFVHLFVRPNCNQYFYGDWYGVNRGVNHYRPWVYQQSHFRNYDPLLAHYSCNRYQQNGVQFLSWVNVQHRYYANHQEVRPRVSLNAHIKVNGSNHDQQQREYLRRATLADNYVNRVRQQPNDQRNRTNNGLNSSRTNRNHVRVDENDKSRTVALRKATLDIAERRRKSEHAERVELVDLTGSKGSTGKLPLARQAGAAPKNNSEQDKKRQQQDAAREARLKEIARDATNRSKQDRDNQLSKPRQPGEVPQKNFYEDKKKQQQNVAREARFKAIAGNITERAKQDRDNPLAKARQRDEQASRSKLEEARRQALKNETERNRNPSESGQVPRSRQADTQAKLASEKTQRAGAAPPAKQQRDLAQQTREEKDRASKGNELRIEQLRVEAQRKQTQLNKEQLDAARTQQTTEQSRLEAQRAQIQRNREETARGQERFERQADVQAKLADVKAQQDAKASESQRQQVLTNRAKDAQIKAARDKAMRDTQAKAARDSQARSARDSSARDAQIKAARDKAMRDAQAKAARDSQARSARDSSARDAQVKAARDKAMRDAQAKAARDSQARAARDNAARDVQIRAARDKAARDSQAKAARDAQARAVRDKAARDAQIKAARDSAQRDAQNRAREQQRQADQARRAQEDQRRRAAEQQKQQQRRQEQEAQKAKKKKN